jgi:hypothetical protein
VRRTACFRNGQIEAITPESGMPVSSINIVKPAEVGGLGDNSALLDLICVHPRKSVADLSLYTDLLWRDLVPRLLLWSRSLQVFRCSFSNAKTVRSELISIGRPQCGILLVSLETVLGVQYTSFT